jgi:hypothetical protein
VVQSHENLAPVSIRGRLSLYVTPQLDGVTRYRLTSSKTWWGNSVVLELFIRPDGYMEPGVQYRAEYERRIRASLRAAPRAWWVP